MSLIPSESYSFPNFYSRTVSAPRFPKEEVTPPAPAPIKPHSREKVSPAVPQVKPKPKERSAPPTPPNKPLARETVLPASPLATPEPPPEEAAPARAPIKWQPRRLRSAPQTLGPQTPASEDTASQSTAESMGMLPEAPANGVGRVRIHTPKRIAPPRKPARITRRPVLEPEIEEVQAAAPESAVTAPLSENLEFEMFSTTAEPQFDNGRRRLMRFIVSELCAISVLVPSAAFALSHSLSDPMAVLLINVLTIAAAAAAVVFPIVFFAINLAIPRSER